MLKNDQHGSSKRVKHAGSYNSQSAMRYVKRHTTPSINLQIICFSWWNGLMMRLESGCWNSFTLSAWRRLLNRNRLWPRSVVCVMNVNNTSGLFSLSPCDSFTRTLTACWTRLSFYCKLIWCQTNTVLNTRPQLHVWSVGRVLSSVYCVSLMNYSTLF